MSDQRPDRRADRLVVTLVTHGGLAAGVAAGRPPRVVDAARLAPGDAATLRRLVSGALAAAPGPAPRAPGAADVASYTVTIDRGGAPQLLRVDDLSLTDPVADLVDWIEENASQR
ncbi:MAG TPA: protealysin inhibitor emfourin [Kineosporiaceae bacterium]